MALKKATDDTHLVPDAEVMNDEDGDNDEYDGDVNVYVGDEDGGGDGIGDEDGAMDERDKASLSELRV